MVPPGRALARVGCEVLIEVVRRFVGTVLKHVDGVRIRCVGRADGRERLICYYSN